MTGILPDGVGNGYDADWAVMEFVGKSGRLVINNGWDDVVETLFHILISKLRAAPVGTHI